MTQKKTHIKLTFISGLGCKEFQNYSLRVLISEPVYINLSASIPFTMVLLLFIFPTMLFIVSLVGLFVSLLLPLVGRVTVACISSNSAGAALASRILSCMMSVLCLS